MVDVTKKVVVGKTVKYDRLLKRQKQTIFTGTRKLRNELAELEKAQITNLDKFLSEVGVVLNDPIFKTQRLEGVLDILQNHIETIIKKLDNKKKEYHNLKNMIIEIMTKYNKRKGIIYVNNCDNANKLYELIKEDINTYIYTSKIENANQRNTSYYIYVGLPVGAGERAQAKKKAAAEKKAIKATEKEANRIDKGKKGKKNSKKN